MSERDTTSINLLIQTELYNNACDVASKLNMGIDDLAITLLRVIAHDFTGDDIIWESNLLKVIGAMKNKQLSRYKHIEQYKIDEIKRIKKFRFLVYNILGDYKKDNYIYIKGKVEAKEEVKRIAMFAEWEREVEEYFNVVEGRIKGENH